MRLKPSKTIRDATRGAWIVYRHYLFLSVSILGGLISARAENKQLVATLFCLCLLCCAAFGFLRMKKANRVLWGDLREKQVAAIKVVSTRMIIAALVFAAMLVCGLSGWLRPPWRDLIGFILAVSFFWLMVSFLRDSARKLHSGKLVLWLRRFHSEPLLGSSFPTLLGCACSGQAIPVTLQDDAYSYCGAVGHFRSPRLFPAVRVTCAAIVISFLLIKFAPSRFQRAIPEVMVVLMLLGMALETRRSSRKYGATLVRNDNFEVVFPALVRGVRDNRSNVPAMAGVVVLRVPDERWQTAVVHLLRACDLVIVDLTDLTENIAWELSAALKEHPPERILITARMKNGATDEEVRRSLQTALCNASSALLASRFQVFVYPDNVGRSRVFVAHDAENGLRNAIQVGLTTHSRFGDGSRSQAQDADIGL